jgi:protein CpxP
MMKKLFPLMLVASVFFSFSASAQKGKMGMEKQVLMDSLKLSSTAADSVIAIREQDMSQIKSIKNDQSLSQDQKKDKAKQIKQDMRMRLKKYLTDDQMAKLQEMKMENKKDKG